MIEGGCRCGAARYAVGLSWPPLTYACHCTLCQRATGSAFAEQYPVPQQKFRVIGALIEAEVAELDGFSTVHRHCASCLTRLFGTSVRRPGLVIIRAGTIDGSRRISPILHIYTDTKQPWLVLPAGVASCSDAALPHQFRELWAQHLGGM